VAVGSWRWYSRRYCQDKGELYGDFFKGELALGRTKKISSFYS